MNLITNDTKHYRLNQFDKLSLENIYPIKIQLFSDGDATNYMDISNSELEAIKRILCVGEDTRACHCLLEKPHTVAHHG